MIKKDWILYVWSMKDDSLSEKNKNKTPSIKNVALFHYLVENN